MITRIKSSAYFLLTGYFGLLFLLPGCKKYDRLQPVSGASYIRVFNATNTPSYPQDPVTNLNSAPPYPFLALLIDPVFDGNGNPYDGAILGDFIGVNNMPVVYFTPHPSRPGEKPVIGYTFNEDYPGTEPVLTAPVINGLDLSRWAQIKGGKHHILFVRRSAADIIFPALPLSNRRPVIIDTVIDLDPGAFTTIQVVNDDITNPDHYLLNVRKEVLNNMSFATDRIYLNFFDFSSDTNYFPPAYDVYYQEYFDSVQGGSPVPTLTKEQYLSSVKKLFAEDILTDAPMVSLPMIPRDSFLLNDGSFRPLNKRPLIILNFYSPGGSQANQAYPLLSIPTGELYPNPNSADPPSPQNGHGVSQGGPLEQVVTVNNRSDVFPLINSFQISTYVANQSNNVKASVITVQRPYGPLPGN